MYQAETILHCTLGQNEGSRGHTNFMYYVSWTGKYIIFARIKSLRHKKLLHLLHFLLYFERFSIERFSFEFFKMVPFRQFLSYKNVPYIKLG